MASPESVHLRNLGGGGGGFYAGGVRFLRLCVPSFLHSLSRRARVDTPLVLSSHRVEDAELAKILDGSFRTRLIQIMDQSQHSLADHGGEGAAYEFSQGLDSWEKERACYPLELRAAKRALTPHTQSSLHRRRDIGKADQDLVRHQGAQAVT